MKSKIELVASAYSQLRISGLTVQPTPEDVELALWRLEDMMAEFWGDTLDFNYQFEETPNPNTQSGVNRVHHRMIASNLAVSLCPDFGKDVPLKLQTIATTSLNSSTAVLARERIKQVAPPSRMPIGSGFRRWGNRFRRYNPPRPVPETLASNEIMYQNDVNDFIETFASWLSTAGGEIDNYDIKVTAGLQLVSSAMTGDRQSVEYRIKAIGDSGLSNQVVTVTVISKQGRQETRERVFNIERPANATSVQASIPPDPPPVFSASLTPVDLFLANSVTCDLDFTVDWGDGVIITYNGGDTATEIAKGATITVESILPVQHFRVLSDTYTALDVTISDTLTNGFQMCRGMTQMTSFAIADASSLTTTEEMFYQCAGLTTVPLFDMSSVTNANTMFYLCSNLTTIPTFVTTSLTSMNAMFGICGSLASFPALDTSNVIDMGSAFLSCSGLTSFPVIDTSNVQVFSATWQNCVGLTGFPALDFSSINATGFDSTWQFCSGLLTFPVIDITVTNRMWKTWAGCSGLTTMPSLNWSATKFFYRCFQNCTGLLSLPAINNVIGLSPDFTEMFSGCSSLICLTSIDSSFNVGTTGMFTGCVAMTAPTPLEQTQIATTTGGLAYVNPAPCP